jgi:LEA14-like dessication related protein
MNWYKYSFLLIVVAFASCASPKSFEFKGIHSLKVEKASFGKNIFQAQFQYNNPNHFKLTLKQLDCAILINDQPFSHYKLDTVFVIPANSDFNLPARLEIELASILKNSVDILFNKPIKISVKGTATLSKGYFTKTMPIEFTTQQKLNLKAILGGTQ